MRSSHHLADACLGQSWGALAKQGSALRTRYGRRQATLGESPIFFSQSFFRLQKQSARCPTRQANGPQSYRCASARQERELACGAASGWNLPGLQAAVRAQVGERRAGGDAAGRAKPALAPYSRPRCARPRSACLTNDESNPRKAGGVPYGVVMGLGRGYVQRRHRAEHVVGSRRATHIARRNHAHCKSGEAIGSKAIVQCASGFPPVLL